MELLRAFINMLYMSRNLQDLPCKKWPITVWRFSLLSFTDIMCYKLYKGFHENSTHFVSRSNSINI